MTTTASVETDTTKARPRAPWPQAALAGLLAGGVTVGVAELIASLMSLLGLGGGQGSPVISVGSAFVDRTPGPVKDFAIRTFGESDKLVLLGSIGVVLVLLAVLAGLVAARNLRAGLGVVVLLGVVAAAAVVTRPAASPLDVLPTVAGTLLGLLVLQRLLTSPAEHDGGWSRRTFLQGAGVAGAAAVVSGGGSRVLEVGARSVEDSRAAIKLPTPVERAAVPEGVQLPIKGITPWQTDPQKFYRVDTALSLPQISTDDWALKVHGMVGEELTLTYAELLEKPLVERAITITCVSNEVGGKLTGNAVWLGYPVSDLLKDLNVDGKADMVLSTSDDGMTISTPLQNLTQGRDALLAIAMNGEPLPIEHGFPVRLVVPGLYGYVSATKWVVDLLITRFDQDEAYWTPRGYSAKAPIKMSSRIDVPRSFAQVKAGKTAVAGMAWAQTQGIKAVQVRVDKGGWKDARLAEAPNENTWVQWVYEWDAPVGQHTLECRVVAENGDVQVEERAKIRPDGTTGIDSKVVTVT